MVAFPSQPTRPVSPGSLRWRLWITRAAGRQPYQHFPVVQQGCVHRDPADRHEVWSAQAAYGRFGLPLRLDSLGEVVRDPRKIQRHVGLTIAVRGPRQIKRRKRERNSNNRSSSLRSPKTGYVPEQRRCCTRCGEQQQRYHADSSIRPHTHSLPDKSPAWHHLRAGAIVKTCGLRFRAGLSEVSKELGDVVVRDQAGKTGWGLPCVVRVPGVGSVVA